LVIRDHVVNANVVLRDTEQRPDLAIDALDGNTGAARITLGVAKVDRIHGSGTRIGDIERSVRAEGHDADRLQLQWRETHPVGAAGDDIPRAGGSERGDADRGDQNGEKKTTLGHRELRFVVLN
jgi:hypothetical protein